MPDSPTVPIEFFFSVRLRETNEKRVPIDRDSIEATHTQTDRQRRTKSFHSYKSGTSKALTPNRASTPGGRGRTDGPQRHSKSRATGSERRRALVPSPRAPVKAARAHPSPPHDPQLGNLVAFASATYLLRRRTRRRRTRRAPRASPPPPAGTPRSRRACPPRPKPRARPNRPPPPAVSPSPHPPRRRRL